MLMIVPPLSVNIFQDLTRLFNLWGLISPQVIAPPSSDKSMFFGVKFMKTAERYHLNFGLGFFLCKFIIERGEKMGYILSLQLVRVCKIKDCCG